MAEKDYKDNDIAVNDCNTGNNTSNNRDDGDPLEISGACSQNGMQVVNEGTTNTLDLAMKKEENPFSFKKFLNQDTTTSRHQTLRRNNYPPENVSNNHDYENYNMLVVDNSSKVLNTSDMASVLPDFVQDHLVIEQCYLNGNAGTINIDNLNLHNLPDLNIQHTRNRDFSVDDDCIGDVNHHSTGGINNLPDFTASIGQYSGRSDLSFCNKSGLPDFAINTSDGVSDMLDEDGGFLNVRDNISKRSNPRNCKFVENGMVNKTGGRMSLSPSVPLDLPSYDSAEASLISSGSAEQPIPFDLTVAAEDRNGSYRGIPSTETVSKSLPDFLSDGPIQNDRLGENLQLGDLVSSVHDGNEQRISPENISNRLDQNRFQRELNVLRRQMAEKNRRIHLLESEIEDLRARERREADSLEYTLRLQMERNLKQAMERASNAESALMKSRMENSRLRAKLVSLKCENVDSDVGISSAARIKSERIAKELRIAATAAENSLRSLLTGIDNLRLIATSVENMHDSNDKTDVLEDFNNEDSASGPAL